MNRSFWFSLSLLCFCFFVVICCSENQSSDIGAAELRWSVDFESGTAENFHYRDDWSIGFSIPYEPGGEEYLWFYFKLYNSAREGLEFVLENAAGAHQTGVRWDITRPTFSADGHTWFRAQEINYNGTVFRFRSPIVASTLWVAYCYPYTNTDLASFVETIQNSNNINISVLGKSQEQRDIIAIHVIEDGDTHEIRKPLIWVIGREHPGETPLSYVCEGIVEALLHSTAGELLRQVYDFTVIPMLNVDGVFHGFYYHSAGGINLARDWIAFESPEASVLHDSLLEDIQAHGVRLLINLHSANDPTKGHYFLVIPEENLTYEDRQFQRQLLRAANNVNPQLQSYSTVNLLPYPGITGNALYSNYDLYSFYLESNYSRGADGSMVTRQTLRDVGAALVEVLAGVLEPEK